MSQAVHRLTDVLVPRFADGCVVHLLTADGRATRIGEHAHDDALRLVLRALPQTIASGLWQGVAHEGVPLRRERARLEDLFGIGRERKQAAEPIELAAATLIPLRTQQGVIGVLTLVDVNGALRAGVDVAFLEQMIALGADGIASARAYEEQRLAGERIERLQRVTEALASMLTTARVAEVAISHGMAALGASAGVVMLLDRTGTALELVRGSGLSPRALEQWQRHPLELTTSMSDAVRTRAPVFIESREAYAARYPAMPEGAHGLPGARISLPLFARDKVIGALCFGFDRDLDLARADREFAAAFARQCSLSLERCLVFKEEAAARARTTSLQRVTAALANARTIDEVSGRLVESVTEALGCPAAWLAVTSEDGAEATLIQAVGKHSAPDWRYRHFPIDMPGPIRDVVETRTPLLFPDQRAYTAAYPEFATAIAHEGYEAAAVLPIVGGDRILAVLGLRFRAPSSFDDDLRELLRAIAAEGAHALERSLLSEAERSARENLTFLLEASRVLSSSLDVDQTLEHLGQLVVPRMADWCSIETLGPGGDAQTRVFVHRHAEKTSFGRELRRRHPPAPHGAIARVLRTGRSEAWFVVGDDELPDAASPEHARGLRELGMRSCLIVSLVSGGTVFGAMTLAIGDGEWRYGPADLALAEEIGARAAVAMANARKHEELVRAREEAERANRTKDEFLAMLGHELRNPLMPILTVVELVRLQQQSSSQPGEHLHRKEWSVVERQGRHLLRLVDDLLDVARITRGKIKLRRRPVEASHLVTRALETASTELEGRRHRVSLDVMSEGLLVDGDEDRLVQVLSNLLNNAARYTDPGGNISVRATDEGAWIVVRVCDSGAGLSEHLLPRVFDSFVQGPRALDRSQGGLGLGLAIVKNIVELHGGEVGATSPGMGLGSEFFVRLPKADPGRVSREPQEVSGPHAASRRKKRVLVVDDNVDAAETLADALRAHGHEVRVVYDGPAALAAVSGWKPNVALLDIGLPVMDGYELAEELRDLLGPRVLLVAVTGYGQPSDVERARVAGFHHHYTKPVDLPMLCTLIDEAAAPLRAPRELIAR